MLPLSLLSLLFSAAWGVAQSLPASPSTATTSVQNSTIRIGWGVTGGNRGVLQDGVTALYTGGNASNVTSGTQAGLLLYFNANETSIAANSTSLGVPFIALVSCDPVTAVSSSNSTNSTLNATTSLTDTFQLAAAMSAQAVLLYSLVDATCILNESYINGNTSKPLPIYSSASLATSRLITAQFSNVPSNHTTFSSALIASLISSLPAGTTPASVAANTSIITDAGFLLASISPSSTNSSSNTTSTTVPIVASIGPASTSTRPTATGSAVGTSTSGGAGMQTGEGSSNKGSGKAWVTLAIVAVTWAYFM